MLSSFTGDLTGAADSNNSLLLVESFLKTLSHTVVLQLLENLNAPKKQIAVFKVSHRPLTVPYRAQSAGFSFANQVNSDSNVSL